MGFRAIPCGLFHKIPVLLQWEALVCPKARFYHNGSVPEILLLENINHYSISHQRFSGTL